MIGETGERKSAVATPDGKSRKKKKKKPVGWHHCIIKSSAGLCILMVAAYSWFQDRGNHHKWESNASTDMTFVVYRGSSINIMEK